MAGMTQAARLFVIALVGVGALLATPQAQSPSPALSLALTGDSIITRPIAVFQEPAFTRLIGLIRGADASFTNLEMLFHDYEPYAMNESGGTYMRAEPALARRPLKSRQPEPALKNRRAEPALGSGRPEPALKNGRPEPALKSRRPEPALKSRRAEPALGSGRPEPALGTGRPEPALKNGRPEPALGSGRQRESSDDSESLRMAMSHSGSAGHAE